MKTLLHGSATPPEVIRAQGLIPRGSAGADAYARLRSHALAPKEMDEMTLKPAAVYLTSKPDIADTFAFFAATAHGNGAAPWVYTVTIPKTRLLLRDIDTPYSWETGRPVPAAWITDARPGTITRMRDLLTHANGWLGG